MTIENDFLPFAVGGGANVIDQAAYAANSSVLSNGFQSGIAPSNQLNKVWRQSSIVATVIAELIVAKSGQPAIDDGTTATLLANLETAITNIAASVSSSVGFNPSAAWTDETGSRAWDGTVYHNTTPFCIFVKINGNGTTNGNGLLYLGAGPTGGTVTSQKVSSNAYEDTSFVVPPGYYYGYTAAGGALHSWSELR